MWWHLIRSTRNKFLGGQHLQKQNPIWKDILVCDHALTPYRSHMTINQAEILVNLIEYWLQTFCILWTDQYNYQHIIFACHIWAKIWVRTTLEFMSLYSLYFRREMFCHQWRTMDITLQRTFHWFRANFSCT